MKDFTKLFCDLISFGSQIGNSASVEQKLQCLAGIVLNENISSLGTIDYEAIRQHIGRLKAANEVQAQWRGADNDIDKPLSIKRITEFHHQLKVELSNGSCLSFNSSDIVHY